MEQTAAPAGRAATAWVWLGALLVIVVAAWAFDAWILPLALAPTASEELARAAEVAWWALTLLTVATGGIAAVHLLPRALAVATATADERPARRLS
ncbi:MAG TPA: hypothetical protein VNK05_08385 [Chloroflexota bacterium]|nr:hypothetical protein [Chloroflexota bacterium]